MLDADVTVPTKNRRFYQLLTKHRGDPQDLWWPRDVTYESVDAAKVEVKRIFAVRSDLDVRVVVHLKQSYTYATYCPDDA